MSPQTRVAVTSDQSLIADTVSAALASSGFHVSRVPWDVGDTPPRPRTEDPVEVGVMLCDLQPAWRLAAARRRVRRTPVPWLVLTGAPPGPLWGGMLESGATSVHRSSATLHEVRWWVERMLAGERLMAEADVSELIRSWHVAEENRRDAVRSVRSLSRREVAVLALMHAGVSVHRIAEALQVSESTVRSHVRSVLQKLDVKTQLAAVAEYEMATAAADGDDIGS